MLRKLEEAALDPGQWIGALDALASHLHSSTAHLIGIGGGAVPFNIGSLMTEDVRSEFVRERFALPDRNYRVHASQGAKRFQIVDERDYARVPRTPRLEAYEAFVDRLDIPLGFQAIICQEGSNLIGLAILRSRKDGVSPEEDRGSLARLLPAVERAVQMQRRSEARQAAILRGTLDAVGTPAIFLNARGQIVEVSAGAEPFIRSGRLRVQDGMLAASDPADDRALGTLIDGLITADEHDLTALSSRRVLHGRPGEIPLMIELIRIPRMTGSLDVAPRYMLVIRGGANDPSMVSSVLRADFRLTESEAGVASLLSQGRSRAEIAEIRGVSIDTVKFQLKAVFTKMSVQRETELVAKLGTLFQA
ncbi:helix-turn-helix transcriptional regulator [Allosphingosinicella deserti]|uniref:helix-turn-helix transcriptional regulator n=1 Tax=Allosphingosinicella deserti TaxID=2116704 RepID=UPI000D0AD31F|nr:helix-turn-helix transcriptional regulator [Sphingomonas deserti]